MRYKPLALAAALVAGYIGGGAEAANVMTGAAMPDIATSQDGNIQLAGHHHHGGSTIWLGLGLAPFLGGGFGYGGYGYGGYGYPYGYGGYGYPYGYGGYGYPYGYGGYGYGGYGYRPRYVAVGGSGHVRYCLNRYRTYNIRTDTFRGYDGYLHRCRSPYRY
jgi:BA14K-like protein